MPPKAECAVFDDSQDWQDIYAGLLKSSGHKVRITATTRQEALDAVKRFGELGIQVALVDGNLNPHEANGNDGQAILAAIRATAPHVKTVGVSGDWINGADVNVGKRKIEGLGKAVTNL